MTDTPNATVRSSSMVASPLLTVEDIVRLKADYEADVRLLEELPSRIRLKKRKYEAALMFAPPGFDPSSPARTEEPFAVEHGPVEASPSAAQLQPEPEFELASQTGEEDGRLTWIGELSRLLDSATRGMAHKELMAILKATELGERVSAGDKGFYNAISRLEKQGKLIKNGGLLYSPRLIEEMKARGETLPDISLEMRRRAGGSATVALEVLRSHPKGLDANQLRAKLAKLPGVPASVKKHTHYIYNVMATLIGQGVAIKDAKGVYKAVREGK